MNKKFDSCFEENFIRNDFINDKSFIEACNKIDNRMVDKFYSSQNPIVQEYLSITTKAAEVCVIKHFGE